MEDVCVIRDIGGVGASEARSVGCKSARREEKDKRFEITNSHHTPHIDSRNSAFWKHLNQKQRKNLLQLDKRTVLKSIKDQQRHMCSCSVCLKVCPILFSACIFPYAKLNAEETSGGIRARGGVRPILQGIRGWKRNSVSENISLLAGIGRSVYKFRFLDKRKLSRRLEVFRNHDLRRIPIDGNSLSTRTSFSNGITIPRGFPGRRKGLDISGCLVVRNGCLTVAEDLLQDGGRCVC